MNNNFHPSNNVASMRPSATLKAMQAAINLRQAGVDLVDLGAGEPDFNTPDNILAAAVKAANHGQTKYTSVSGTRAFQDAVIGYYEREFNAEIRRDELMATAGGKQAIFNAVVTLINPGDEVLIMNPFWVTLPEIVRFAGGKPVFVETADNDFVLTWERVREAITPRTRLAILNSPSNPSGRVIPPEEFVQIAGELAERKIYTISDECYLQLVYPPATVFTAVSLPASYRRFVCIAGSLSKTYAMTGWRIGYAIAPAGWTSSMFLVESHSTGNASSVSQAAAVEALSGPQVSVQEMLNEYCKRRDWLVAELNKIPGFRCPLPEGAFYAFPDIRGVLGGRVKTSAEFCDLLLSEAHTVVTDGEGFGASGYMRLSYATSMERLREGINRIKDLVSKL